MLKKSWLVLLLVLLASCAVYADPYGPARQDLEQNEVRIDYGVLRDQIDPAVVESIIWQEINGATITNTISGDKYIFFFDPSYLAYFCIGQPNGDHIAVEFQKDPDPNSIGIRLVISGPYGGPFVLNIPDNWTMMDIFNAIRATYLQVTGTVNDSEVWMAVKVLLELLQKYYP